MKEILKREKRDREMELLEDYLDGSYTKENIIFYSKFFGEVNIRMDFGYHLPVHHFRDFSGYYKLIFRDKILDDTY
jgi:hypothetical protein